MHTKALVTGKATRNLLDATLASIWLICSPGFHKLPQGTTSHPVAMWFKAAAMKVARYGVGWMRTMVFGPTSQGSKAGRDERNEWNQKATIEMIATLLAGPVDCLLWWHDDDEEEDDDDMMIVMVLMMMMMMVMVMVMVMMRIMVMMMMMMTTWWWWWWWWGWWWWRRRRRRRWLSRRHGDVWWWPGCSSSFESTLPLEEALANLRNEPASAWGAPRRTEIVNVTGGGVPVYTNKSLIYCHTRYTCNWILLFTVTYSMQHTRWKAQYNKTHLTLHLIWSHSWCLRERSDTFLCCRSNWTEPCNRWIGRWRKPSSPCSVWSGLSSPANQALKKEEGRKKAVVCVLVRDGILTDLWWEQLVVFLVSLARSG